MGVIQVILLGQPKQYRHVSKSGVGNRYYGYANHPTLGLLWFSLYDCFLSYRQFCLNESPDSTSSFELGLDRIGRYPPALLHKYNISQE